MSQATFAMGQVDLPDTMRDFVKSHPTLLWHFLRMPPEAQILNYERLTRAHATRLRCRHPIDASRDLTPLRLISDT